MYEIGKLYKIKKEYRELFNSNDRVDHILVVGFCECFKKDKCIRGEFCEGYLKVVGCDKFLCGYDTNRTLAAYNNKMFYEEIKQKGE